MDPAAYISRLGDERKRLKQFKTENLDVEASLGLSYENLEPETAHVFRQLAVFPSSFDVAAEEKVCEDEDHAHLDDLVRKSLVTYDVEDHRYNLHNLVRVFAGAKLTQAERAVAERRHSAHYETVLRAANASYLRGGVGVLGGLRLFDLEWPNIQAGQGWAVEHSADDDQAAKLCNSYPEAGVFILDLRQHPRDRIEWRATALAAARRLGNRSFEGSHLANLGLAYASLGEYNRATEYYEQSLAIAREIGDRRGEGKALGNLGLAYASLGEYNRATEYYEQSLAIAREIGDRRSEGQDLGNLGATFLAMSQYRRAIGYHEESLAIAREIGDRFGEGNALGNLGLAYGHLGEYRRAVQYYEQHIAIAQEIGDRWGASNALYNLSLALDAVGNRAEAIENAQASLRIREEIEDPWADNVRRQLAEWKAESAK